MITVNLIRGDALERRRAQNRAAGAKWRASHPGRAAEVQRRYRKAHHEQVLAYGIKYMVEHREERRAYDHEYRAKNIAVALVRTAKSRADRKGLDFSITLSDVVIPEFCPILGTRLQLGVGRSLQDVPSIDRIVPSLGYVPGNVRVVSFRANRLRSDATIDELRMVLADAVRLGCVK